MYKVEVFKKRIVAIRIVSCDTVDEARSIAKDISAALTSNPGLSVATADFRSAGIFPPEVPPVLLALLKADNPKIERSAHILASGNAVFMMQIERLVREAANPARRTFREPLEAIAYLGEVISAEEAQWVRTWLFKP
jgi:hypothetical protein